MAESSSSPCSTAVAVPPVSPTMKENRAQAGSMMAELDKSQSELVTRLQGLKQDMQSWRSKLDTQVKTYKNELSELKSSLSTELEQLRSEFQELRVTLQQQQVDVTNSLKILGIEDVSKDPQNVKGDGELEKTEDSEDACSPSSGNNNGECELNQE